MNQAVTSTNVVLNMAISPTLWLIPNNLIILEKPIVGYNNKLKVSDESMNFGLNKNVNYFGTIINQPKKVHQDQAPTHHLETLDDIPKQEKEVIPQKEKKETNNGKIKEKTDDHNTELITIMTISGIATYLIINYML